MNLDIEKLLETLNISDKSTLVSRMVNAGDSFLSGEQYDQALQLYKAAFDLDPENYRSILKMGLCHLSMKNYHSAQKELVRYLTRNDLDANIWFGLGKAYYHVGKYEKAKESFQKAISLDKSLFKSRQVGDYIRKTGIRMNELQGKYDPMYLYKSIKESYQEYRPDLADFTSNVEIRDAGEKGNGLFATKDIAQGGLVLVEKAMFAIFFSEWDIPTDDKMLSLSVPGVTQDTMIKIARSKLLEDESLSRKILKLYAADTDDKKEEIQRALSSSEMNSKELLHLAGDWIRLFNMIAKNTFMISDTFRNSLNGVGKTRTPLGKGVWFYSSFMNNDCSSNTLIITAGDVMILRAMKSIKKGEEITCDYFGMQQEYVERAEKIQRNHCFICKCALCESQRDVHEKHPGVVTFMQKLYELLAVPVTSARHGKQMLSKIKPVLRNIEEMYKDTYHNPLYGAYRRLFYMHSFANDYEGMIKMLDNAIKSRGFSTWMMTEDPRECTVVDMAVIGILALKIKIIKVKRPNDQDTINQVEEAGQRSCNIVFGTPAVFSDICSMYSFY